MTAPVFAVPQFPVFHGLDGLPLDGGSIYIGYAGQSAEAAPLPVFWDDARTIPAAQPVRTVNGYPDRNGSPASIYVFSDATTQDYSITVRDRSGRLVYTALQGLDLAQAAIDSAWQAAQAASAFDGNGLWVNDATAFFDNTSYTYTADQPGTVTAGQYIRSRKEGYSWRVAASGASDHHVVTAGGVKGYVDASILHPEMFGKVGTAVLDTAAILAAMALNRDVDFPANSYQINQSIMLSDQRLRGRGKHGARAQTLIQPQGNFPAFINLDDFWNSCDVDGFFIDYGATTPTTSVGNDEKIGFKFTNSPVAGGGAIGWPEQIRVSNCTVQGAWYGMYDDTGTYQSVIERVEARNCKIGFYKQNGTTIAFINTFARGDGWLEASPKKSEMGFFIREVLGVSFLACAADGLTPAGEAYGESANIFEGCRGVTINGWDAESNDIGGGKNYMRFISGAADLRGFIGYKNILRSPSTVETRLILNDGCNLTFGGQTAQALADLEYIGTGGIPITIKTVNAGRTLVSGSVVWAATGGVPSASFALVGGATESVDYVATETSGLITGASELVSVERLASAALGSLGTTGMFLNATTGLIVEGNIVPGTSLIWCAADGGISGVDSPAGSWRCLGTCAANAAPAVPNPACVSLFRRVV